MKNLDAPVIQIESLKTKFDTVVVSNSLIALLDHNYNEARFLQQLHYWSYSEYGVVIDGIRWIYKSGREWLAEALVGLTEWKLRKAIASLLERNLIRREKLFTKHQKQEYKSFWWQPKNQTYYYSINYEELENLIKTAEAGLALAPFGVLKDTAPHNASFPAESIENVRIEDSTELSVEEIKTTKCCELSQNRSKTTNYKKITTKQSNDHHSEKIESIAAATSKRGLEEEKKQKKGNPHTAELTTPSSQIKRELDSNKSNIGKETNNGKVDYKVNKELIALLDSVGVPVNKTIRDLLKLYPAEKVEGAIAIVKARKRESYIPNLSGYFVAALKGDWGAKNLVSELGCDRDSEEIDKGAIFRHWYDLSRELGYCSGQEMREGEQWICLSGSWEKWSDAVNRGYSLSYLKKIIKRNQGQ